TQEGMNPFGKMGALQVSLEQSLSPSYNLGLLWEPTDNFGFGMLQIPNNSKSVIMSLLFLKGLQTTSSTIRNTPIISLGKRKSV
ncbi:outer membrane protein transport protein, partial [Acinetobacter baumannii]|nr:outer membrane protein transport protein [Acinetobacter baumannii]